MALLTCYKQRCRSTSLRTPTTNTQHTVSKSTPCQWTHRRDSVCTVYTGTLLQRRSYTAIVSFTCSSDQLRNGSGTTNLSSTGKHWRRSLFHNCVHEPHTFLLRSLAIAMYYCNLQPITSTTSITHMRNDTPTTHQRHTSDPHRILYFSTPPLNNSSLRKKDPDLTSTARE